MLTRALQAVGNAIGDLTAEPGCEHIVETLREIHGELSERLARGVQGEIFPEPQQLCLPTEPEEIELELELHTC